MTWKPKARVRPERVWGSFERQIDYCSRADPLVSSSLCLCCFCWEGRWMSRVELCNSSLMSAVLDCGILHFYLPPRLCFPGWRSMNISSRGSCCVSEEMKESMNSGWKGSFYWWITVIVHFCWWFGNRGEKKSLGLHTFSSLQSTWQSEWAFPIFLSFSIVPRGWFPMIIRLLFTQPHNCSNHKVVTEK